MTARDASVEKLFSIREAADVLGISRGQLYRLIGAGDLTIVKVGGRTLMTPEDLRAYIDAHRERRQPEAAA